MSNFDAIMQRMEALIHEAERRLEPEALEVTRELVQTVLAMHHDGLEMLLATLRAERPEDHEATLRVLCTQPVVASMLMLHELNPLAGTGTEDTIEPPGTSRLVPVEALYDRRPTR